MSEINISIEDIAFFGEEIPQEKDIIFSSYALIANKVGRLYRWHSPIIITTEEIIFYQPLHSRFKEGINKVELYKTHVFKNYKHIYVSSWDIRPKYNERAPETKNEFKTRWKSFQKTVLPHVINSMKEHLKYIEANKDNSEFYNDKDNMELPWFGTEKKLEKHIQKVLPKFEKKLAKITK
jgi:hypothetical protein